MEADFKTVIDGHTDNIATGLGGGGLQDCAEDLPTCNASLTSTQGQLTTCNSGLSDCYSDLGNSNTNLGICQVGTALAADVLAGKTFSSSAGLGLTGTATTGSNVMGADGTLVMTIPDGHYSGSKTCTASDTDLSAANIKSGVNLLVSPAVCRAVAAC